MNKEDILAISRRENQNRDLAEMETAAQAGNIASRVGAGVCCLVSVMFFSILGTHYLVKFRKAKRKTDLVLTALFFAMCLLCFVLFLLRLAEVKG